MISHSSRIFSVGKFPTAPDRQSETGDKKVLRQCAQRIKGMESFLDRTDLVSESKNLATRRLDSAKRFLQSRELGACNYELHVLELLIDQIDKSSG